ncbi:MAG: GyrI-like domain-containing protein [Acidimicrobiia bacterium]|nr:GyrI-like domain-containing protein [Acidimicrobiia bacterium]
MASIDLTKVYRQHYAATRDEPAIVEVPLRPYLMIDGRGDPNTSDEYREAIEALYPLAYGLRTSVKRATGDAYKVMPLEGLWWAPDMSRFDPDDKSDWLWTAMICLPDAVTHSMVDHVLPAVTDKKRLAAGAKARVESFGDGTAAQVLHVGPYAEEAPTIESLHRFIAEHGSILVGKHHEIYLSDPRRSDPARLRTIIRQPIADA